MTEPTRRVPTRDERVLAGRKDLNTPIELARARWDGSRSIRIALERDRGLATTAYSYGLTDDEKERAARRIAALWDLATARRWSTKEIEEMARVAGGKNRADGD